MRVKSFRGNDAKSVLARIRCELGPEAVILSNQTVKEDGRIYCEIMAALESEESETSPGFEEEIMTARDSSVKTLPGDFSREWGEIREHLLTLLRPEMDLNLLSQRQRTAMDFMEREGVDTAVQLNIFREIKSDKNASVLPVLGRIAKTKPFSEDLWPQKHHAFAGPHGAGKTSTLIRLALMHKRNHPGHKVCLVNVDGGRGKGRLILRHYADLSGLGFFDFAPGDDISALAQAAQGFQKVFFDLPGLSGPKDLADWLKDSGLRGLDDLQLHLVLSPHYCSRQLKAFYAKYGCPELASLIWTKLDEACAFGDLVNLAHHSGLPVSALSYGSGMKNSLAPAESQSLLRLLFKHEFPGCEAETCRRLQ